MSNWFSHAALVGVLVLSGCVSPAVDRGSAEPRQEKTSSARLGPSSSGPASPSGTAGTERSSELPTFTVSNGTVKGPSRLSVKLGDDVAFTVTSDVADEVHVHTYDVTVALKAGEPATVRVHADIPGVHEVELEEGHVRITQLRVSP